MQTRRKGANVYGDLWAQSPGWSLPHNAPLQIRTQPLKGNTSTQGHPPLVARPVGHPSLCSLHCSPPLVYDTCCHLWSHLLVRSLKGGASSVSPHHDSVWPISKQAWGQRSRDHSHRQPGRLRHTCLWSFTQTGADIMSRSWASLAHSRCPMNLSPLPMSQVPCRCSR